MKPVHSLSRCWWPALACACLAVPLVFCSRSPSRSPRTLAEFDTAGKSPQEIASFVFENYGCERCHTLGRSGKLGFTAEGESLKKGSLGCIALLTSMSVIAHVPEAERTEDDRRTATHFQEFGCTLCHQVSPGRLELTGTGKKLASLHLSCVEVQRQLSQQ